MTRNIDDLDAVDDVIARLRNHTFMEHGVEKIEPICEEAADTIEHLRRIIVDERADYYAVTQMSSTVARRWRTKYTQIMLLRDELFDELTNLRAVVAALRARPFRGTREERRHRMYGSDWDDVHSALDRLEGKGD